MFPNSLQITSLATGAAFFVAQLLIGFVWGHEAVIHTLADRDPHVTPKKPLWTQAESCSRIKHAARAFFPLYWYWGNVRSAVVFAVIAFASSPDMLRPAQAFIASLLILFANLILLRTSKQPHWKATDDPINPSSLE